MTSLHRLALSDLFGDFLDMCVLTVLSDLLRSFPFTISNACRNTPIREGVLTRTYTENRTCAACWDAILTEGGFFEARVLIASPPSPEPQC